MPPPDATEPEEPTRKIAFNPVPPRIAQLIQQRIARLKGTTPTPTPTRPRGLTRAYPRYGKAAQRLTPIIRPPFRAKHALHPIAWSESLPPTTPSIAGPLLTAAATFLLAQLLDALKKHSHPQTAWDTLHAIAEQGEFLGYYTGEETDIVDVRVSDGSIHLHVGSIYGENLTPGLILLLEEISKPSPRWARITINCNPPTRQYVTALFSLTTDDGWAVPYFLTHLDLNDGYNHHLSGFAQDLTKGLFQISLVSPSFPRRLSCTLGNQSFPTTWAESSWSLDLNAGVYLGLTTHGDKQDIATAEYTIEPATGASTNALTLYFGTNFPTRNLIMFDSAFILQYGPPIKDPFTASTMGLTQQELDEITKSA